MACQWWVTSHMEAIFSGKTLWRYRDKDPCCLEHGTPIHNHHSIIQTSRNVPREGDPEKADPGGSCYLMRFLKRNSTFSGESAFLLAVSCKSAPSANMRCNTLAMFFVSSIPRWWLPKSGICSSFIIVIIPVAFQSKIKHISKKRRKTLQTNDRK